MAKSAFSVFSLHHVAGNAEDFFHMVTGQDFLGGAVAEDAAFFHEVEGVAVVGRQAQIVNHDEDGLAALLQIIEKEELMADVQVFVGSSRMIVSTPWATARARKTISARRRRVSECFARKNR